MENPHLPLRPRARTSRLGDGLIRSLVRLAPAALLGLITVTASPTLAGPDAPAGSITYSREVPHRHAQLPGEPGDVSAVRTAPTQTIFAAADAVPLTDLQFSEITAQVFVGDNSALGRALDSAFGVLTSSQQQAGPSSSAALEHGGGGGGGIGGAIDQGTSAIQGGLSALGGGIGGAKP